MDSDLYNGYPPFEQLGPESSTKFLSGSDIDSVDIFYSFNYYVLLVK